VITYQRFLYILIILFVSVQVSAQQETRLNFHKTKVIVDGKTIVKDSLTIDPASIFITSGSDTLKITTSYIVQNNKILLSDKGISKYRSDTLSIEYQTLGVDMGKQFYLLDSVALSQTDDVIKTGFEFKLDKKEDNVFGRNDLSYDGSFSRGFSVGNRQSLVLNSNFNLQMNGNISEDIEIAAALTDANIPIQAEGNTYQLNEFDRVFIQINKDKHVLTAGDLELRNPITHFSRYQKKIKGIRYSDLFSFDKKHELSTDVSYAISRGKFARNELKTQEGNQGPYKLTGNSGEQFLIVLSGTEKVYFDGVPLKRGSDFDYIIDYNLAEISFTFNRMITKDSRIIVEFEYVDQSYMRSMQTATIDWTRGKSKTYFNFYNEQDSKTSLGNVNLDSTDINILSNSGDDIIGASRNGIRFVNEENSSSDIIFYRKEFNPEVNDSILVYDSGTENGRYTAYFSDVGESNGSYSIKEGTTLNGRIYEYVGKDNGRYEPIIRLVAPERKQLITVGNQTTLSKNTLLNSEISISNKDINRFSSLDDNDNIGTAGFIQLISKKVFEQKTDSTVNKILSADISYEFVNQLFNPLNPYRSAEFNRDWNLTGTDEKVNEHSILSTFGMEWNKIKLNYGFTGFFRSGEFDGYKHMPTLSWNAGGTSLLFDGNFLHTSSNELNTRFFRPKFSLKQKLKFLNNTEIGFLFNQEKNRIYKKDSLALEANSFYFNNFRWTLISGNKKNLPLQFYINFRQDYKAAQTDFNKNFRSLDAGIKGKWLVGEISKLDYNLTYRQLSIDTLYDGQSIKPANTILGKLTHSLKWLNEFLVLNSQVDLNSGQEAKSEFIFIELTNSGEGNYIWIDSNEDGIQQKGEFEAAPFSDEANFIKIIQYNNEFVRVNNAAFNHTFRISPHRIINKEKKSVFLNQLSRFSMIGAVKIQEKTLDQGSSGFAFPFFTNLPDTSIVVLNNSRNITAYYNKLSPLFDIQYNNRYNRSRNLQLDGLIQHESLVHMLRYRLSIKKRFDLILSGKTGYKAYEAALYEFKNYHFDLHEFETSVKYRYSQKTGLQFSYRYINRENNSALEEKLTGNRFDLKLNLRNWRQLNLSFSMEYARYAYNGETDNSIELAMLEGLKDGNNYLWNVNVTRKMSNNIDLSFRYEGRKTGNLKTVHVASMQAKARF
jgi:hypothetical protein